MKKVLFVILILSLMMAMVFPAFASPLPKVDICHITDTGEYDLINVSANALPAHQAHGDIEPGTFPLDNNCDRYVDPCFSFTIIGLFEPNC